MEGEPQIAVVDIKFNREVYKVNLTAESDAVIEAHNFLIENNLPEKFKAPVTRRFQETIDKLCAPMAKSIVHNNVLNTTSINEEQVSVIDPYASFANPYQTFDTSICEQPKQNPFMQTDFSTQPLANADNIFGEYVEQQYEQQPEVEDQSLVNETLQHIDVYQRLYQSKLKPHPPQAQRPRISFAQQEAAFDRLQKQRVKKDLEEPVQKQTVSFEKQAQAINRLYKPAAPVPKQRILTSDEVQLQCIKEITAPETEKVPMSAYSKELTDGYQFKVVMEHTAKKYEEKRRLELLRSTTSEEIVKRLTKNLPAAERLFWSEELKKRQQKITPVEKPVKELQMSTFNNRTVYKLVEPECDFKPKINKSIGAEGQKLRTDRKLDDQIKKKCAQIQPVQEYRFQPTLVSKKGKDYKQEIIGTLFE
ncbi:Conserved_hypothetical protein [Hexamita inflata]|uniref:Uncharacterized protein n=1 Tax=Hexamita inflata TaxID=28002 RepID=A0AA86PH29_9EUKA|nr:Conserved hypothetical protein [Hexamita inflata]